MNPSTETSLELAVYPALNFLQRLRAMFAVVVVGVLWVAWIGRTVLVPLDPLACVSISTAEWGWWIIPACVALAAVLSMAVCAITSGKLPEMGLFAVALGLSLAVLRYGNASYLWAYIGRGDDSRRRMLSLFLALESAAWISVVAAAWWGSLWVIRTLKLTPISQPPADSELRSGPLTVLIMSIIAALGLLIFSAGTELAPIQTGQVCFAIAAAFYLASLIGYQLTGAQSPIWGYGAVAVVAVGGYLWTALYPTPHYPGRAIANLIQFAPSAFGRALPVQVVMVGTVAATFGNWHQRQLTRYAIMEDSRQ